MCEIVRCKSYEINHRVYFTDFPIYNMEGKCFCHLMIAQMGLVTGSLFTLYTVYIYAASTWRLLQVYNTFKGEHKVSYFLS